MPATAPKTSPPIQALLVQLGQQIRARRKTLGVSAIVAAEAAGMSRVTLHRIENGEPSVTMGAYLNALSALGLSLKIAEISTSVTQTVEDREGWIPAQIHLSDYPQLKQLAWQVQGTDVLTPIEALSIYERNRRHLDFDALDLKEKHLIEALQTGLGNQYV